MAGTLTESEFTHMLKATQAIGQSLSIDVQAFRVHDANDLERAFSALAKAHVDGFIELAVNLNVAFKKAMLARRATVVNRSSWARLQEPSRIRP